MPGPRPRPTPITDVGAEIAKKVENDLKKRFNLPTLPPKIKDLVNKTAAEVAGTVTKQNITKRAVTYGKDFLRDGDPKEVVGATLAKAVVSMQLVGQSADLQKMLDENAKLLFKKKTALVNAGFTGGEAFQLILAEVSARKSK